MTSDQRAATRSPAPLGRVALVWIALCAILVLYAYPNIAARKFVDPDDALRLVQVRDLLAGQGWFDLHQYRIDTPAGTLMHWSRLVDVPLALVIGALTPLLGAMRAEQAALIVVPLFTLGALLAVVGRIAARFLDREGVTLACLCVGLSPLLMMQLQPMRIDHHGWQVFAVMLAMTGLLPGKAVRGAAIAGAALALGLSISLELLPLAAGFGAVLALRWLADRRSGEALAAFLASLAGMLALLFLATRGLSDLAQHCDAISPAHLGFFAIAAAATGGAVAVRPRSRAALVVLLALGLGAAFGFYLWAAPQCAAGPFGSLDPLVREYWYDNVREGRPVWEVSPRLWLPVVAQGVVALAVLVGLWLGAHGDERRWWFEYLALTALALVAGLLVWRSMAFVGALAALPLGWLGARLLKAMSDGKNVARKLASAAAIMLVLVPGFPIAMAMSLVPGSAAAEGNEIRPAGACELSAAAPALDRLEAGTVFAPLDLGPTLLDGTHHSVVATGHHRAAAAMHDVIAAFLGSPDQARDLIHRHGARFVLVCTDLREFGVYASAAPQGFAADLMAGRAPPWLEPVAVEGSPALKVWRVAD